MTWGIIFALLGSMAFAMNAVTMRRGITRGPASQGLYMTVLLGTVLFVLVALGTGQAFKIGSVPGTDLGFMMAAGVVHLLGGRYCNYRAVGAMGSNRSSPVVGLSMLASVFIAIVWLGEEITVTKVTGIALVMLGPTVVARRRRRVTPAMPAGAGNTDAGGAAVGTRVRPFEPKLLEGYAFGMMAALLWGVGPVLMRAGVDGNGLGVLGGTIGYLAAAVVLLPTLLFPGQVAGAMTLDKGARKLFLVAGLGSSLANMFRFSALALAPVTVVIPLMRSALVFSVLLNFIFNRHLESYEPRVLGGMAIGMVGAILVIV